MAGTLFLHCRCDAINYSVEESQAEKKGWRERVELNSYVN